MSKISRDVIFSEKKAPAGRSTTSPRAWFHYLPLFAANHSAICCYLQLTIPLCADIELLSKKIGWGFMLAPHTATGFNSSG